MLDVSKSRHIADAQERPASEARPAQRLQVVLVFQGGGALGAYQAGVYEGLHEAGIRPNWVAGISIGALNAAIIAGSPESQRVDRLREFWETICASPVEWPVSEGLAESLPFTMDLRSAHIRRASMKACTKRESGRTG